MKRFSLPRTPATIIGLIIILLAFLVSGCADLKGITALSEISTATLKNTTFADDYLTSLERQKRYAVYGSSADYEKLIEERKKIHGQLLQIYGVASDYTNALGKLASDDIISYDKNVDALVNQLKETKYQSGKNVFDASQVQAFGIVGKLLFKAATDNYRQDKLKIIIEDSNSSFAKVIDTLKEFNEHYKIELGNEKNLLRIRYERSIRDIRSNEELFRAVVTLQNDVSIIMEDTYNFKSDEIEAKIKGVTAYNNSLEKIKKAHQDLYNNRNNVSSDQVRSRLKVYSQDLSDIYSYIKNLK